VAADIVLLAAVTGLLLPRSRSEVPVDVSGARKEAIAEIVTAVTAGTMKSRREATESADVPIRAIDPPFTFPVFVEIFARGYPARNAASLHSIGAMRYE
jgi:hypothetical protein